MPLYLAFQNDYDETAVIGVFSSPEKAAEALGFDLADMTEDESGGFLKFDDRSNYWRSVKIEKLELDETINRPDYSDWGSPGMLGE